MINHHHALPNHRPEIAIVEFNILAALGLKSILIELIPVAEIRIFQGFEAFMDDTPDMYAHYFISAPIYIEHNSFFLPRKKRTIVMASEAQATLLSGVFVLDVFKTEKQVIKSLIDLHKQAHEPGHSRNKNAVAAHQVHELSPREIEVISLIAMGMTNKEIADRLNIGQTTVITHRKNITDKLGIKSVSGLTIYAVINGYTDLHQI
ncbi:helix-turn-helix transcriptional regulator [Bacteroides propionicifaciens]|jgi:DNA-binding CsgD family transcriptional regulator|uniref:helix-turn-helix transcriptional regulator n=1 Tax=Bacteroides propionicifaciens TaxID=392838 RepID=UPI0003654B7D|nr:LuxR family transcriptional regulator [Bacteroides propionicifaciens]